MPENVDRFSNRLSDAIKAAGILQIDLAERIGVTRSAVYRWIKGEKLPTIPQLEAFAGVLQVDRVWLSTGVGQMPMVDPDRGAHQERSAARPICCTFNLWNMILRSSSRSFSERLHHDGPQR
jgi:transcriptional regulator with XRE-family HTH domain